MNKEITKTTEQAALERIEGKLDKLIEDTASARRKNMASAGASGGICGAMVAAAVTLIKSGMSGS